MLFPEKKRPCCFSLTPSWTPKCQRCLKLSPSPLSPLKPCHRLPKVAGSLLLFRVPVVLSVQSLASRSCLRSQPLVLSFTLLHSPAFSLVLGELTRFIRWLRLSLMATHLCCTPGSSRGGNQPPSCRRRSRKTIWGLGLGLWLRGARCPQFPRGRALGSETVNSVAHLTASVCSQLTENWSRWGAHGYSKHSGKITQALRTCQAPGTLCFWILASFSSMQMAFWDFPLKLKRTFHPIFQA